MKKPLSETHPDIAAQWDYESNIISPHDITYGSSKKFFWIGSCGHQWDDTVKNRTMKGYGCPYCSGKRILSGYNDLATTNPELVHQWNDKTDITTYSHGSHYKASWICEHGHKWVASIASRVQGNGCPVCAGKVVLPGFNDLATTHPEVAELMKDDTLAPTEVSAGSNKKVGWKCEHGHEWKAVVASVVSGHRCPICAQQKPEERVNDLTVTHPGISALWHPDNELLPNEVSSGSGKKVKWLYPCNHESENTVRAVVKVNGRCPYCEGKDVIDGFNSLADIVPESLDYYSGIGVSPREVRPYSGKKISWTCDHGHEWESTASMFASGNRCPVCSGHRTKPGFNCLLSHNPELAKQWHPTKNGEKTPDSVTSGSNYKAWWICDKGHEWQAKVVGRANGYGCRRCSAAESKGEKELYEFLVSLLGEDQIDRNNRELIKPYEVDFYLRNHNVAIEFNGLYWHSEDQGKYSKYHYNKWKICEYKDVQLITVWEDDWRDRQEIMKKMITHKLALSDGDRFFARKGTVVKVDSQQAEEFMTSYHIQGSTAGGTHWGIINGNGDIVALSSWRKVKDTLYLDRYATSCHVVGGLGKLLKQAKKYGKERGCTQIVTFADHGVSDGGLYEKLGFVLDKEITPDYSYLVKGERKHKFNYRKAKFKSRPDLFYDPGMTESELAVANGLPRIWDSGKYRYVLDL